VKLEVVAVTADKFRDKVTVTDADVASHFDAHKAEYRIGEQRKIKYLLIDRDQIRQRVAVTPQEIQKFYNDNIQQFQQPEQIRASHILLKTEGKDEAAVRKQAEDILKEVKAPGADFAALAKKYSEDEGSKEKGGDLDYFGRGRMVPEFDTAVFAMQPGQTSDLVKSQFGFHIIRLVDRKPAVTRSLDEVKAQIQDQITSQKADAQMAERARQLQDRVKKRADLDTVAKEQGLMVQESGLFQREEPVPGLGAAPQVSAAAFRLKDDEVAEPVASPRGLVILAVSEKKDPYVPKLDEVKEKVRQDVIRVKAAEMSQQRAGEIAVSLKAAKDFAAAAKAQGLEAKPTELVTRGAALPDVGTSPEVDKVAFALPKGGVSDPIRTADGTVIVRVIEREEVTPEKWKSARETFRDDLLNERRTRFFTAYMMKVKDKIKVEVKSDVLRRILAARSS